MAKGDTTTTTQSNPKPYGPARPLLRTAFNDAMNAYKQGQGSQVYTGSTVVPFSQQTEQANKGLMGLAGKNIGGDGLSGNLQGIINRGGFNQQQNQALNGMENSLDRLGRNGLTNPQDQALANFRNTANSSYDMNANPGFQGVLDNALNDARNQVDLSASAAGRYGSAVHQGEVAKQTGNIANQMISSDFNNWLGRKDAANQNMASLGQQGFGNLQSGQGNIFNAAQAGLGNMTQAYQGQLQPYQTMAGVGAQNEDLYKRTLDDRLRVFDAQNNAPWNQIQKLLSAAGAGGQYAQGSTTSTAPGPNPILSGLGVASGGLGILGQLGII